MPDTKIDEADMGQVVDTTDPHNPSTSLVDLTEARKIAAEMPDKFVYVDIYGVTTICDEQQTGHILRSHLYVPTIRDKVECMRDQQQTDQYFKNIHITKSSHLYSDNMSDADKIRSLQHALGQKKASES